MVDAARSERRRKWFGDVLLPNDFGERCRTVLAVESHGSRLPIASDAAGLWPKFAKALAHGRGGSYPQIGFHPQIRRDAGLTSLFHAAFH